MLLKEWVRAARKAKGWTQTQLGDAVGVSKANISAWELAYHEPSFSQMLKVSEVTGYPVPGDPASGLVEFEPTSEHASGTSLSPLERDLIAALRSLPEKEQHAFVDEVVRRSEEIESLVQRALAQRGILVSGQGAPARAAPPSVQVTAPAPGAPGGANRRIHIMGHVPERRGSTQIHDSHAPRMPTNGKKDAN